MRFFRFYQTEWKYSYIYFCVLWILLTKRFLNIINADDVKWNYLYQTCIINILTLIIESLSDTHCHWWIFIDFSRRKEFLQEVKIIELLKNYKRFDILLSLVLSFLTKISVYKINLCCLKNFILSSCICYIFQPIGDFSFFVNWVKNTFWIAVAWYFFFP